MTFIAIVLVKYYKCNLFFIINCNNTQFKIQTALSLKLYGRVYLFFITSILASPKERLSYASTGLANAMDKAAPSRDIAKIFFINLTFIIFIANSFNNVSIKST